MNGPIAKESEMSAKGKNLLAKPLNTRSKSHGSTRSFAWGPPKAGIASDDNQGGSSSGGAASKKDGSHSSKTKQEAPSTLEGLIGASLIAEIDNESVGTPGGSKLSASQKRRARRRKQRAIMEEKSLEDKKEGPANSALGPDTTSALLSAREGTAKLSPEITQTTLPSSIEGLGNNVGEHVLRSGGGRTIGRSLSGSHDGGRRRGGEVIRPGLKNMIGKNIIIDEYSQLGSPHRSSRAKVSAPNFDSTPGGAASTSQPAFGTGTPSSIVSSGIKWNVRGDAMPPGIPATSGINSARSTGTIWGSSGVIANSIGSKPFGGGGTNTLLVSRGVAKDHFIGAGRSGLPTSGNHKPLVSVWGTGSNKSKQPSSVTSQPESSQLRADAAEWTPRAPNRLPLNSIPPSLGVHHHLGLEGTAVLGLAGTASAASGMSSSNAMGYRGGQAKQGTAVSPTAGIHFQVVPSEGVAYRSHPDLRMRVVEVKGPHGGEIVRASVVHEAWIKLPNGYWLPRIVDGLRVLVRVDVNVTEETTESAKKPLLPHPTVGSGRAGGDLSHLSQRPFNSSSLTNTQPLTQHQTSHSHLHPRPPPRTGPAPHSFSPVGTNLISPSTSMNDSPGPSRLSLERDDKSTSKPLSGASHSSAKNVVEVVHHEHNAAPHIGKFTALAAASSPPLVGTSQVSSRSTSVERSEIVRMAKEIVNKIVKASTLGGIILQPSEAEGGPQRWNLASNRKMDHSSSDFELLGINNPKISLEVGGRPVEDQSLSAKEDTRPPTDLARIAKVEEKLSHLLLQVRQQREQFTITGGTRKDAGRGAHASKAFILRIEDALQAVSDITPDVSPGENKLGDRYADANFSTELIELRNTVAQLESEKLSLRRERDSLHNDYIATKLSLKSALSLVNTMDTRNLQLTAQLKQLERMFENKHQNQKPIKDSYMQRKGLHAIGRAPKSSSHLNSSSEIPVFGLQSMSNPKNLFMHQFERERSVPARRTSRLLGDLSLNNSTDLYPSRSFPLPGLDLARLSNAVEDAPDDNNVVAAFFGPGNSQSSASRSLRK